MEQDGLKSRGHHAGHAVKGGEPMDSHHRAIRALLKSMSPRRAEAYIKAFCLQDDEEAVLIQGDVRGLSYVEIGDKLHMTPEVVKRRRRAAYAKIVDAIEYEESRG